MAVFNLSPNKPMHQDTIVLRPRIRKLLILSIASALFFTGGEWMVLENTPKGWFVAIFFGIAFLFSLLQLLPGANSLTLTKSGFTIKSIFRRHFIAWEDVQSFQLGKLAGEDAVCFDFKPHHQRHQKAKQLSRRLSGSEAVLPDTYGLLAEDLLSTLESWRRDTAP